MREMKKQAELELEEKRRRQLAEHQFKKDKELARKAAREEKHRQIEARQREIERMQKAEEHRQHTRSLVKRQQDQILAKMKEMKEQERIRAAAFRIAREKKKVARA